MGARTYAALLQACGLEPREGRLLLARACGVEAAIIAAFPERYAEAAAAACFAAWAARRRGGEPVAYLLGEREFFGRVFAVDANTLIPRPETELLIELALERMTQAAPRVLDLGTGSGVIAITLASERADARVTAVDRSPAALEAARRNATRLAPGRVECLCGDWFSPVAGRRFDLIVSNPPYVAADDAHLAQGDLRFEPLAALTGGASGLECLAAIAAAAPGHLMPGAWLLLEHGFDQGEATRELLDGAGFATVETWRDLGGQPRVSGGRWRL